MQRKWLVAGVAGATGMLMIGAAGTVRAQTATGAASPQATSKAQKEIEATVRQQCAAMEHGDVDAADRPYTDDYYIDETPGGPVNKATRDKSTKELIAAAQALKVQATISEVHLSADGRTATLVEKTHLSFSTHATKSEKPHTLVLDGAASEVWVKTAGPKPTWLKRSKKSIAMTEMVDGVPYKPPAPTPPPAAAPANPPAASGSTTP